VEEPSEEASAVAGGDFLLPNREPDFATVLLAGPMLGEQARPVPGITAHFEAALPLDASNPITGTYGVHGGHALRAETRPGIGAEDAKDEDALTMGLADTAVTEVET
jgi:hypothetical protein